MGEPRPWVGLNVSVDHAWGIVGTGNIARAFVRSLENVPEATVAAVASREIASALDFASTHGIARAHRGVDAIAADASVEVAYVAGINTVHADHTVALLEAGKHVLVEKPIALSLSEVDRMTAAARSNGRFLMEAMWMRFNPLHVEILGRVSTGEFGRVLGVESDFTFDRPYDAGHRLFDPAQGGGSLLDVGIYPLTLAWSLLGPPATRVAHVGLTPSGVDDSVRLELGWPDGATALLTCGSRAEGTRTSVIRLQNAEVHIPPPSHAASSATIHTADGRVEHVGASQASLHHQVLEVHRCIEHGLLESPAMPHALSRAVLGFMLDVLAGR